MAKRLFLLHIGPTSVDGSAMTDALALGRIVVPDVDAEVLTHAGLEIRRTHKAAGLKRKHVEGAWAKVCRKAHKSGSDCFASVPDFFEATPEQAALALDVQPARSEQRDAVVVRFAFEGTGKVRHHRQFARDRRHLIDGGRATVSHGDLLQREQVRWACWTSSSRW